MESLPSEIHERIVRLLDTPSRKALKLVSRCLRDAATLPRDAEDAALLRSILGEDTLFDVKRRWHDFTWRPLDPVLPRIHERSEYVARPGHPLEQHAPPGLVGVVRSMLQRQRDVVDEAMVEASQYHERSESLEAKIRGHIPQEYDPPGRRGHNSGFLITAKTSSRLIPDDDGVQRVKTETTLKIDADSGLRFYVKALVSSDEPHRITIVGHQDRFLLALLLCAWIPPPGGPPPVIEWTSPPGGHARLDQWSKQNIKNFCMRCFRRVGVTFSF